MFVVVVLLISSCSTPRTPSFLLPKRPLIFTFYTDGTCEYSFNGMGSGKRINQSWSSFGNADENGGLNIFCSNELVQEGGDFTRASPEIWPKVNIRLKKILSPAIENHEGHIVFQPEPKRNHYGYGWNDTIAKANGFGYSAWVSLGPGTQENEEALPIKGIEKYNCQTEFSSDNSSSNIGYIYSREYQESTGIYIHVITNVNAQKYAPGVPC